MTLFLVDGSDSYIGNASYGYTCENGDGYGSGYILDVGPFYWDEWITEE